jgi:phosphoglycerate dehydrogenase-like enzyme
MTRIAILDDYQNVSLSYADWGTLQPDCDVVVFTDHVADRDALIARLADFDVVMAMRERTPFPRDVLERLPRLKLLVTTGKSNASIDVAAARARSIVVCGTESLGPPTAELTWGLILALLRHIPREEAALRAGRWQTTVGSGLHGKVLGIVGLGRIGAQVAQVGRAFGMEVLAWSPRMTPVEAAAKGCHYEPLPRLLANADLVTLHARLDPSSLGMIGKTELQAMKRSACLVNTARGGLIDHAAVAEALHARTIAGYAADVFDVEPLPLDHPLRSAPNTVLTPHLGYVTAETYRIFYSQALEDIQAYLRGAPIRVIDR